MNNLFCVYSRSFESPKPKEIEGKCHCSLFTTREPEVQTSTLTCPRSQMFVQELRPELRLHGPRVNRQLIGLVQPYWLTVSRQSWDLNPGHLFQESTLMQISTWPVKQPH